MSNSRQTQIRSLSVRFSPGHHVPWHQHGWSQLIYATEGTMRVEVEGEMWIVPTRRAIWVPAGHRHQIEMQGRVHLRTIYSKQSLSRYGLKKPSAVNIPSLLHELIIEVCNRSVVESNNVESRTLIRFFNQQLRRLAIIPLSIPMPDDERARLFAQSLLSNPGDRTGLGQLAGQCGTSLRTIQRLFQLELGVSLSQWRNKARMLAAVELLSRNLSVTEVALESGFESPSAFIHAFGKFFGESPGKYRLRSNSKLVSS